MSVKIFFCYAHEDEPLLNKLKTHLKPLQQQGLIYVWYDNNISAGTDWEHEISRHLNEADLILLLVSPDFMNSDYCYGIEMKRAMERHERGEAYVIPIILRPTLWQRASFSHLQVLPINAKPITNWGNLDDAFLNIAIDIQTIIESKKIDTILTSSPASPISKEIDLLHQDYEEDRDARKPPHEAGIEKEKVLETPEEYSIKHGMSLIGRDKDIREIMTKLHKDNAQFLTLVGAPGAGKTALARKVGQIEQQQQYFSNVSFVSLDNIRTIELVFNIIDDNIRTINLEKKTLLIIDNCEQIEDMKIARAKISDLLFKYQQLFILATSRVDFSQEMHQVFPLTLPNDPNEPISKLIEYESVKLFIQRTNGAMTLNNQNAAKIAAICIGLDGLPLALEIAASWASNFSIDEVYDRLLNRDILRMNNLVPDSDRHETLEKLIAYSYYLLSNHEQKLFRRIAIFIDGCDIKSVAKICNLRDLPRDVATISNYIRTLSSHHLVTFKENTIKIPHATLSAYAMQKLIAHKEVEKITKRYDSLLEVDYDLRRSLVVETAAQRLNTLPSVEPSEYTHERLMTALAREHVQYMQRASRETVPVPEFLKPYLQTYEKEYEFPIIRPYRVRDRRLRFTLNQKRKVILLYIKKLGINCFHYLRSVWQHLKPKNTDNQNGPQSIP